MRSDGAPVRPGARTPRLMSKAFEACKAEWDQVRGHHQGQRSREGRINRPDTRLHPTSRQNIKSSLATREPSTQDTSSWASASEQINDAGNEVRQGQRGKDGHWVTNELE